MKLWIDVPWDLHVNDKFYNIRLNIKVDPFCPLFCSNNFSFGDIDLKISLLKNRIGLYLRESSLNGHKMLLFSFLRDEGILGKLFFRLSCKIGKVF